MRRFILAFLVTTVAATPAFAQTARELRQAAREKKADTADEAPSEPRERTRRDRVEQPRPDVRPPSLAPVDGEQASRPAIDRAVDRGRASTFDDRPGPRVEPPSSGDQDSVANWRRGERDRLRQNRSEDMVDFIRRRARAPDEARPDRPAPPPRTTERRGHSPRWGSSWHRDHRYNWRDHRRRHRSLFRLGFYFDPFGWSYRRYNRGWRLWPSYYDRSYWLNDPYMYRLPYAPHPYKWVRYWNDALLVDTYTGQVVDVVHDVFW